MSASPVPVIVDCGQKRRSFKKVPLPFRECKGDRPKGCVRVLERTTSTNRIARMRVARHAFRFSGSIRIAYARCATRVSRQLSTAAPTTPSSVNEEEIKFFSKLSSQWWDETGEFRLLHKMNPMRVRFIREKLLQVSRDDGVEDESIEVSARPLKGLNILDIGCGGGLLSESLTRLGATTLGIDASASNIAVASLHSSQDPALNDAALSYRKASAEDLVKESSQFDAVCSMEVLEHVDNPAAFLQCSAALVKPGGHLFLSTVSRTPLAHLLTIFAAEKVFRLVEPGTHSFDKYVKPHELIDFFQKPAVGGAEGPWISALYGGIPPRTEAEVRGIIYLPWKGTWELAPRNAIGSTECNYLFWARKPGR